MKFESDCCFRPHEMLGGTMHYLSRAPVAGYIGIRIEHFLPRAPDPATPTTFVAAASSYLPLQPPVARGLKFLF